MDPSDDAVLLARARSDDPEAFGSLVARYEKALENILLAFTNDRSQARDLVQEAVLRAFTNLHRYREEHRFSTWFFRIGVNLAITARRRSVYEQRALDPTERRGPAGRLQPPETPLEAMLREENANQLREAVSRLPERYQMVLHLRYGEELSCQEIARRLKSTANSISIILFRAKQRLKQDLEAQES